MKAEPSQTLPPGLYIVATPIGNLKDITLRALETLEAVDVVACEDTRVSASLLKHYGIKKPCVSYNDHNGQTRRPQLLADIQGGKRIALISDAGTPLISDPGYKLVREVQMAGLHVTTLPGASSVMAALCLAGLPTNKFFFTGFLPTKKGQRADAIKKLKPIPATLVLFETGPRIAESLAALANGLGNRRATLTRELTKLFEEALPGTLENLAAHYADQPAPKGEIVLVIGPPENESDEAVDIEQQLQLLMADHSVKEAASIMAEQTGKPRKEIYALALKLKS